MKHVAVLLPIEDGGPNRGKDLFSEEIYDHMWLGCFFPFVIGYPVKSSMQMSL